MQISHGHRLPFRQVFEDLKDEFAFGEDDDPGGQEDEHEVRPEDDMFLIPHFKRTLVLPSLPLLVLTILKDDKCLNEGNAAQCDLKKFKFMTTGA